jgi:hypothetical protein
LLNLPHNYTTPNPKPPHNLQSGVHGSKMVKNFLQVKNHTAGVKMAQITGKQVYDALMKDRRFSADPIFEDLNALIYSMPDIFKEMLDKRYPPHCSRQESSLRKIH